MIIHISIISVWFPVSITLLSILFVGIVAFKESKNCKDFELPITIFTAIMSTTVSLTIWVIYILGCFRS